MLAALYLRLSRDEEQKGLVEALHNHREALIKLAENNNLQYDIYQEVSSGMNSTRVELNKLLENIHEYDYVLCMDIDRLTRDNVYAEQLKQIFYMNDIKILTPTGEIDFNNESNDLLYSFSSLLANYEWKQIRKRMSRGRLAAAGQGKWVGSNRVPLGYKKNKEKKLEIEENEAKIVRFIFNKLLEGYSAHRITIELDKLNWRTKRGKTITTTHISLMRKNPVYYGTVAMKRRVNGKVVDEVFVENAHEGIISKETFLALQKTRVKDQKFNLREKGTVHVKLHGLIYCSVCKRRRYIRTDGKTNTYYIKSCGSKIVTDVCTDRGRKYDEIEKLVFEDIKREKKSLEKKRDILLKSDDNQEIKNLEIRISSLKANRNKLNTRKKNLLVMRSDGEISKSEFEEFKNEIDEQLKSVEGEIELLEIKKNSVKNRDEEINRLNYIINQIDFIDDMNTIEVNAFLKTIINKVYFTSNESKLDSTAKGLKNRENFTVEIEYKE
ncbi:recombinase family protein [Niallia sp. FSL W8-0951]|uniref:recombinase family protein n=1 Tax=Niallia sp. FSL W8-0951 TaxID=2954639 RepID=UPI0030F71A70